MDKNPNIQDSRAPNKSQIKSKNQDLLERLTEFHVRVVRLCKKIPLNPINSRIVSQLIASSGSVGANYAEASEAASRKEFAKMLKISRKETKEFGVWLPGLKAATDGFEEEFGSLLQESREFIYIFTSILKKVDV